MELTTLGSIFQYSANNSTSWTTIGSEPTTLDWSGRTTPEIKNHHGASTTQTSQPSKLDDNGELTLTAYFSASEASTLSGFQTERPRTMVRGFRIMYPDGTTVGTTGTTVSGLGYVKFFQICGGMSFTGEEQIAEYKVIVKLNASAYSSAT